MAIDGPPPSDDEFAARSFPGYVVDQVLGRGGFGTVYRARSPDGKLVAIKESRADVPEASSRLLREAEVLAAVGPPHVPALIEHGAFASGTQFIVMELVDAPPLADLLLQQGARSVVECIAIATAVLRPLAALHARGFVHRDLKPENILYDATCERAVLIDFGLARIHRDHPSRELEELTVEGMLVGTTDYMAPEQHDGRLDLDATADIYAMGIILFELLTGRVPFFGPEALVREAHRSQRPPPLSAFVPHISPPLETIVLRCLAKSSGARFSNATALAMALRDASQNEAPRDPIDIRNALEPPRSRPGGRSRTELRMAAILSFSSLLDGIAMRRYLEPKGAQIVHTNGGRYVVAFGQSIDANPARRGLLVAREMLADGRAAQIMLDVGQVSVRHSPDGGYRISAPHLAHAASFPAAASPRDIVLSDAARTVLDASDIPIEAFVTSPPSITYDIPSSGTPSSRTSVMLRRDALLNAIVTAANRAVNAALPTVAVITAEAGYGKSQICRALASRLQLAVPEATLVNLQAQSPAGGTTHGSLRELLLCSLDLAALRHGRLDEARHHFARAIDAASMIPNVMRERLEHWMSQLPKRGGNDAPRQGEIISSS